MIQLFRVSKNYDGDVPALTDVTLKIEKGEFLFITGPSGAGKSTLLKILSGAEAPSSGSIIIDGRNYLRIPCQELLRLRRRMGFVFQDSKLINSRSVLENVAISLKIKGEPPSEVKAKALKTLSYVKLLHRANFRPLSLSGGEQQRVSLARALVKEPEILVADEPTGNLDPELADEVMGIFREINGRGTTVIVATHDKALISKLDKRVVAIEHGRLVSG